MTSVPLPSTPTINASAGRLLNVPPAAGASVTLCQYHEARKLALSRGKNHVRLDPQMTLCHTLPQWCQMLSCKGKFSLNTECESHRVCSFLHSHFSSDSGQKTWELFRKLTLKNTPLSSKHPIPEQRLSFSIFLCYPHTLAQFFKWDSGNFWIRFPKLLVKQEDSQVPFQEAGSESLDWIKEFGLWQSIPGNNYTF